MEYLLLVSRLAARSLSEDVALVVDALRTRLSLTGYSKASLNGADDTEWKVFSRLWCQHSNSTSNGDANGCQAYVRCCQFGRSIVDKIRSTSHMCDM